MILEDGMTAICEGLINKIATLWSGVGKGRNEEREMI